MREATAMRSVCDFSELRAIDGGSDMGVFNTEPVVNSPLDMYDNGTHSTTPAQKVVNPPPKVPPTLTSLNDRVTALEGDMKQVKRNTAEILHRLLSNNEVSR